MIYISPTQIEKFDRCERLISYEYVQHMKPPPSVKQSFGTAVHANLERWLSKGKMPDETPEGATAKQGIRNNWLPSPSSALLVEHDFEIPFSKEVHVRGKIDCVVPGAVPIVIDHKTTSDLIWTKTPEELRIDAQAIVYSIYAALKYSADQVRARWIYYSASNPKNGPRKPTGAKAVELVFDVASAEFLEQWDSLCERLKRIAHIRNEGIYPNELPPSPQNCSAFGGCYFKDECKLSGLDQLASAIKNEERKTK